MAMVKVACSGCRFLMEMEAPRQPQILNLAAVSVIVVEHPEQGFCPQCNTPVTAFVMGAQLQVVANPLPPELQKRVLVIPPGVVKQ